MTIHVLAMWPLECPVPALPFLDNSGRLGRPEFELSNRPAEVRRWNDGPFR